jgi:uncharacterized protein with PQ loop repeat
MEALAYAFSILSMLFYSIVYWPQFYTIYKNKSSDGISIWMLAAWNQADAFALFAVIFSNLNITLIIICWYHFLIGTIMLLYSFFYQRQKQVHELVFLLVFITTNITISAILSVYITTPQFHLGDLFGWITTALYIVGRVPQIILNMQRRSTDGLSVLMYVYTIFGNAFYAASVISYSLEPTYLRTVLPWIVLTCVTVTLDIFVIMQHYYYLNRVATVNQDLEQ